MPTVVPFFDLPCPIWICDRSEAALLDCNAAARRLLGWNKDQADGPAPAEFGLKASAGVVVTIGLPQGPSFRASISRMEIAWQGRPAVMLVGTVEPMASGLTAVVDTAEPRHALMKRALTFAGCHLMEGNSSSDLVVSPEIRRLLGLPEAKATVSTADLAARIHPEDRERYMAAQQPPAQPGAMSETMLRIVPADGGLRHVKLITGTDTESGNRRIVLLQDMTDAVIAAEQKDCSEALLNLVSDLARLGGWRRVLMPERLDVTEHLGKIFDMPDGTFSIAAAQGCYDAAVSADLLRARDRVIHDRVEASGEYAIRAMDGTTKSIRVLQRPVLDDAGNTTAVVGAVQDISEIVALRDEAASKALRLQNTVENMPDGFFLHDRHVCYLYANPIGKEMDGVAHVPDDELRGKSLWDIMPSLEPQLRSRYEQLLLDGIPVSTLIEVAGRTLRVNAHRTPDGLGVHVRNVTQEIEAQRRLADSEERYRLAYRASRDVMFDWNITQDILTWSDAAQDRFGYDPKTFPRHVGDWLSIIHPGDRERMQHLAAISTGAGHNEAWSSEYRLFRADGSTAYVLDRSISVPDQMGQPVRMIGTITDVTKIREEEQRLRAIIDVAADAIFEFDPKRSVTIYSDGMRRTFGHDWVGELPSPTAWVGMIHHDDRDGVMSGFDAFCKGNQATWRSEYRMTKGDGNVAQVRLKARAVREDDGTLVRVIGSLEDVTLQRHAEERVKQAERLEAIGNLTGGVAHDFNNLLTVVLGNAELLEENARLDSDARERAAVILRAAERGAELTAGLLAFAGKQPLAPKTLDTDAALAEIHRLLVRTLPADIALDVLIRDDLWLVEADPAQLNAALLNLAVNARDAMPEGGRLLIECSNVRLDDAFIRIDPDARPGEFLRIAVTDTGTGMTPQVAARVFEPFYTTKPRGAGSGMGLSMVRGFVQQSGGHVSLDTELGRGTTIGLFLPRSKADQAEPVIGPTASALGGRGEHVLVVEDNPLLLPHVSRMIEGLGYRVSSAADAKAALAILDLADTIDLLFTDVVMPGSIDGAMLAKRALVARPGLKVLFTSGYTEDAILHLGRLDRGVALLSKPYRRYELAKKLREVIDRTE